MNIAEAAAVYIETSILWKLPFDIASPEFLKLKEFCENLQIPILTTKLCVDEFAEKHKKEVVKAISRISAGLEILSGYTISPPQVTWPKDKAAILEEVNGRIGEAIRALDIQVLDNFYVDQGRLLEMAVEKIRPFTEKGEKGFRDTIILFTIINHEKQRGGTGHGLIVAEDKTFAEALHQLPEAQGVNLVVSASIMDAAKHLEAYLGREWLEYYERRSETLLAFLNQNRDQIEKFIQRKTSFPLFFLMGPEIQASEIIDGIESINLVDIQDAIPGNLSGGMKEGKVKISFAAKVKLTLRVRLSPISSFLEFRFRSEDLSEEVQQPLFLKEERARIQRTVDRTLFVDASALLTIEEGRDEYADLVLEKVRSFRGFASLLFKGLEE